MMLNDRKGKRTVEPIALRRGVYREARETTREEVEKRNRSVLLERKFFVSSWILITAVYGSPFTRLVCWVRYAASRFPPIIERWFLPSTSSIPYRV